MRLFDRRGVHARRNWRPSLEGLETGAALRRRFEAGVGQSGVNPRIRQQALPDDDHDDHDDGDHDPRQRGRTDRPDGHVHLAAGNVQRPPADRGRDQASGVRCEVHRPVFRRCAAVLRSVVHDPHLQRRQKRGKQPIPPRVRPDHPVPAGRSRRRSRQSPTRSPARPKGSRSSSRPTSSSHPTPNSSISALPPGPPPTTPRSPIRACRRT